MNRFVPFPVVVERALLLRFRTPVIDTHPLILGPSRQAKLKVVVKIYLGKYYVIIDIFCPRVDQLF